MSKFIFYNILLFSMIEARSITLKEAIDSTLKNYPDVKSMQMRVEQSKLSHRVTYSDYLPQISISGEYNLQETYVLPMNGSFHTEDDTGWSAGISAKQKLWDFYATASKIAAAKKDIEISQLSLKEFKALLAFKVKSTYKLAILNYESIKVQREDIKLKKAYYKQAKELLKQGLKTPADASSFLAALYEAKDALAASEAEYQKALYALSIYMGRELNRGVTLQRGVLKKSIKISSSIEKEVLRSNYQLGIQNKNIEKNLLLHKATKAQRYGTIDAVASYRHFDTLNSYDSTNLGVAINIPLYTGGKISSQAEQMRVATLISSEQKLSKRLALKEELNNLLFDIKHYNKTIIAKKAQVKYALEAKKVLDNRYKEGLTTYIEVLDANQKLLNAKLGLLQAYYLRSITIDRIQYLKGKI